jgi:hypothetical protein
MKRPAFASKVFVSASLGLWTAHVAAPEPARAEPPPPVDVLVKEEPPERRVVALEWNPVGLLYDRISASLEIVPVSHHGLVLTPYYFDSSTAAFETENLVQVPSQRFRGFGGEIGYRYYTGLGGPRGFFVGPSLILAWVQATAGDGTQISLSDYGIAVDMGYEALVADNWVVALGIGADYTFTSRSLPEQQWPANAYANCGFHPRPLVSLGYAF